MISISYGAYFRLARDTRAIFGHKLIARVVPADASLA